MAVKERPLSKLKGVKTVFHPTLINFDVRNRQDLNIIPQIEQLIIELGEELKGKGASTLLRHPVPVPGEGGGIFFLNENQKFCHRIAEVVAEKIGL